MEPDTWQELNRLYDANLITPTEYLMRTQVLVNLGIPHPDSRNYPADRPASSPEPATVSFDVETLQRTIGVLDANPVPQPQWNPAPRYGSARYTTGTVPGSPIRVSGERQGREGNQSVRPEVEYPSFKSGMKKVLDRLQK